jgi:plastocyanin
MAMTSRLKIRRLSLALVGTVLLAACGGSPGTPAASAAATASAAPASLGPAALTIQATDGGITGAPPQFVPMNFSIKSGDVLRLTDTGTSEHNLTIDTTGLIPTSGASRSDRILIAVNLLTLSAQAPIDLPPGTYRFYCSIDFGTGAGHTSLQGTGMVGTLTVH